MNDYLKKQGDFTRNSTNAPEVGVSDVKAGEPTLYCRLCGAGLPKAEVSGLCGLCRAKRDALFAPIPPLPPPCKGCNEPLASHEQIGGVCDTCREKMTAPWGDIVDAFKGAVHAAVKNPSRTPLFDPTACAIPPFEFEEVLRFTPGAPAQPPAATRAVHGVDHGVDSWIATTMRYDPIILDKETQRVAQQLADAASRIVTGLRDPLAQLQSSLPAAATSALAAIARMRERQAMRALMGFDPTPTPPPVIDPPSLSLQWSPPTWRTPGHLSSLLLSSAPTMDRVEDDHTIRPEGEPAYLRLSAVQVCTARELAARVAEEGWPATFPRVRDWFLMVCRSATVLYGSADDDAYGGEPRWHLRKDDTYAICGRTLNRSRLTLLSQIGFPGQPGAQCWPCVHDWLLLVAEDR